MIEEVASDYVEQQIVKKEVVYQRPTLFSRVMASLIDMILLVIFTFLILLVAREVVNRTPDHINRLNIVNNTRVESCLYVKSGGKVINTSEYLKKNTDITTYKKKMDEAFHYIEGYHYDDEESGVHIHINGFLTFCSEEGRGSQELYTEVKEHYENYILSQKYSGDGRYYFIRDEFNNIVYNQECQGGYEGCFKVLCNYMDNKGVAILSGKFPFYANALRSLSIDLFAIELPISYAIAGILVYFIPPLIFKRGRKTLGKLAYRIGAVGPDLLNISFKKFVFRFLIFYFAIMLLSVVTFAVPMLISFSMMVFSKGKQSFQDYMLGIYEISTAGTKVYYDLEEAEIDQLNTAKKPVDFKRVERE